MRGLAENRDQPSYDSRLASWPYPARITDAGRPPKARAPDANLDRSTNPRTRTYWVSIWATAGSREILGTYRLRIVAAGLAFLPQHGPGRKHHRSIVLEDWQNRIVGSYPRQLPRGLIHSDGCRTINRVRDGRYAYPRYFFTNHSPDILEIFRQACDASQLAHPTSKLDTISIARREAVAALDAFIGPKS